MCIESVNRQVNDGFTLPGKKLDDGKAEQLEATLIETIKTGQNLSEANKSLAETACEGSKSVATLVATNASLQETNTFLQKKINTFEEERTANVERAVLEPKTPEKIPQSDKKVMAMTPATTTTKKKKPTTAKKTHNFVDGGKVTIRDSYSNKPGYAGKTGKIASHSNTMVTVEFTDGTKSITMAAKSVLHGWE